MFGAETCCTETGAKVFVCGRSPVYITALSESQRTRYSDERSPAAGQFGAS
jgi:hypothetical protein